MRTARTGPQERAGLTPLTHCERRRAWQGLEVHPLAQVGRVGTDSAGRLVVWGGGGGEEGLLVQGMEWEGRGTEAGMEAVAALVETLQASVEGL